MGNYILKRIVVSFPVLFVVTFLAFLLVELVPSDPAEVALRVNGAVATEEAVELVREELGLDQPFLTRYVDWMTSSFTLDFGTSFINGKPVLDEILQALPATFQLAIASLVVIILISVPVGVLCAIWKDSWFDKLVRFVIFILTAMPNYWVGLLLIAYVSVKMDLLPTGGRGSWQHLILPTVTLSLTYISTYVRLIRGNMIANLNESYVVYAKARGLYEKSIILKHVLVNSLHTAITSFGMSIAKLIAGAFVVETVFSWPGIGMLCVSAIFNRDYPVIQAYILMMALIFILCNLIVDIVNHYIDPRLRREVS